MNVLLVGPRYYPHVGGIEHVMKSVAEHLVKTGHYVVVLAGEPRAKEPVEETINGVHVIRWPTFAPRSVYHIPKQKSQLDKLVLELVREADVVHAHSAHAVFPVYVALKAKKINPMTRLIITLHYHAAGHTLIRELLWRLYWRRKVANLIHVADKVHAVSDYEAKLIANHYSHAKEKLVVIPNGVEEDVFQYEWKGQNSNYMIYAGRIEKYKRLELAVNLTKELDLDLLIVGKGAHKRRLEKYAEKRAPGRVKFLLPQPRQRYLELLANARYAVNPSKHEAFSIFIAEALAMKVPCIVSRTLAEMYCIKSYNFTHPMSTREKDSSENAMNGFNLVLLTNTNIRSGVNTWNDIVLSYILPTYQEL